MYESNSGRDTEESSQDDCLPFFLDDDSSGPEGSPSFSRRKSSVKSTYGFSINEKVDRKETITNTMKYVNQSSRHSNVIRQNIESISSRHAGHKLSDQSHTEPQNLRDQRLATTRSRGMK